MNNNEFTLSNYVLLGKGKLIDAVQAVNNLEVLDMSHCIEGLAAKYPITLNEDGEDIVRFQQVVSSKELEEPHAQLLQEAFSVFVIKQK
ncbi:hypothetical protein [Bacillus thuringiensis]|uniref:Uncharacterized protein n=1 Tax=Bacillus thuringiensis TaxID=1428 RepID=A0A9X6WR83_BACTU|nr:hypothetical protein [Bacillus thuringiensis]PFJ42746.1 hypothetical protein COJ15_05230 [Bacillus thuringiensis]